MPSDSLRKLRWGDVAPIPETSGAFNVTTADQVALRANPNRTQVYLTNPLGTTVVCRWGEAATTTLGYPVPPNGGSIVFTYEEDGERVFEELHVIGSAAGTIFISADQITQAGASLPAPRRVT